MRLKKLDPAIKDQFCEQLYEKSIVASSEILMKYEEYAYTIHAKMPVSCYTNFRDALFHFRKATCSMEENEIEQQAFAVKEHLSRSLTDAGSCILYHLCGVAELLLKDETIVDIEWKRQIRKCLHKLKNANIRKRFSGMMISDDDLSNISHDEILKLVDGFYTLLNDRYSVEFAKYSNGFINFEENGMENIIKKIADSYMVQNSSLTEDKAMEMARKILE